jgi:hypothetical protein
MPKKKTAVTQTQEETTRTHAEARAKATGATTVDETVTVGNDTLEATPLRLMQLLRGIGTIKAVRAVLRARGYTAEEHARGWQLLHACSGFVEGEDEGNTAVAETIAAIDAWDEPTYAIAEAALRHRHPAQHAFVFGDLSASRGIAAVVGAHTFLTRLDALESSPERAATRAADHAALATLSARGINAAERARVWALVRAAESFTEDDAVDDGHDLTAAEQTSRLRAARAFFEEWSEITRTLVTRRDLLIRLGLAQRKSASDEAADDPPAPTPRPG